MAAFRSKRPYDGAPRKGAPFFARDKERAIALARLFAIVCVCAFAVLAIFGVSSIVGSAGTSEQEGSSPTDLPSTETAGQPEASEEQADAVPEGEGWSAALASAYSLEDNDGWDQTASGVPLDDSTPTVAVPIEQEGLLGAQVDIFYEGMTVRATVTDTGSFGEEGRMFDLSPAIWQGFGCSSVDDWGVREVSYRFVS